MHSSKSLSILVVGAGHCGGRTVQALREALIARGAAWAKALDGARAVRVAVNQTMARADTPIKAGDEVAFFPPVTGG